MRSHNTLAQSSAPSNDTSRTESDFAIPSPPTGSPAGYLLLDEIGRGGMGVIHRARDVALGREVAIKILADQLPPRSAAALRFVEEARITGQLQHPGIPAVHQVGELPDGRPYLAMKLIQGRTLDELLKARSDSTVDHGRFLAIFEAICQAVGYAHASKVIHRDLKPQNIMVGEFGEVQVMDWGLAKAVRTSTGRPHEDADEPAETKIQIARGMDEMTRAGSVLGTPAYMPPEQAIGAIDQIDARSDVFGLGGILSVILTGRPPFVGTDMESTRQLAAQGKLEAAFAQLDQIGAAPELVALCKRCLSVDKADRPDHAGEVAQTVANLRSAAEERARTAELDQRALTVRAVEDRKRRLVVTLATGIVAAVLVIGTGVSLWQARRADNQAAKAMREKERADTQYRQARLALLRMLEMFETEGAASIPQVVEMRRAQSEQVLSYFESIGAEKEDADPGQRADLAAASKEAARLQIALGQRIPAERNVRRAIRLLEGASGEAANDPESRTTLATSFDLLGTLLNGDLPGKGDEAVACGKKAVEINEQLVHDFPANARFKFHLAQTCDNLGTLYRQHPGGSVRDLYERSLALHRELHRNQPERVQFAVALAETCSNLGSVYWGNNLPDKADAVLKEGVEILEPLVAAHPDHVWYASTLASLRINRGSLLLTRGRVKDAIPQFDQALTALQGILQREPNHAQARSDLLPAHGGRAQALNQIGRYAESAKDWDRVIELAPTPNRPGYRLERAGVLIKAGDFTKAAAEADDVAGAEKAEARSLFEAGRLHARIAAAMKNSPGLADQHAARAVEWLRKAQTAGFFKSRTELGSLNQREFASLKSRADFQTLLREISETLKGK